MADTDKQPGTEEVLLQPDASGAEAEETGGEKPQAESQTQGLSPEQIQAYLEQHPEAYGLLQVRAKVDGREVKLPLAQAVAAAQLEQASRRRFEEAARIRKQAEEALAQAAQRSDPVQVLMQALEKLQKPPAPKDPLQDVTQALEAADGFGAIRGLTEVIAAERQQTAERIKQLEAKIIELGGKLPDTEKVVKTHLGQWEARNRLAAELAEARRACPDFTASLTTGENGEVKIDYGDNPAFTAAVLALAATTTPQAALGGKSGKELPLAEVAKAQLRAEEERVRARQEALAKAREAERRQAAQVVTGAPPGMSLPEEIANMPDKLPDGRPNLEKARRIREYWAGLTT